MSDIYEHLYTERARGVQPSAIREICKVCGRENVKSLAGGWPDAASFPSEQIRQIANELLTNDPEAVLQYGTPEWLPPLREELARWAAKEDEIACDPDRILILQGSQQGMDLCCRVFLEPGDVVLAGLPTYFGGTGAVNARGGQVVGVPLDEQGMDTEALAATVERLQGVGKKVKGVYVIPNFQNPSGTTLSLERRRKILELAAQYRFVIFEDDPYGELRFEGEHLPSLASLDKTGLVVHFHSASKTFAPGMRLAWAVAHPDVIDKMDLSKQCSDISCNTLAQFLLLELIRSGGFTEGIERSRLHYRLKRDLALELMAAHFPDEVSWTRPAGGFFIFVTLPDNVDAGELLKDALKKNIAYVSGSAFYVDGGGKNTFRLSYSQAGDDVMRSAIPELAELIRKRLAS